MVGVRPAVVVAVVALATALAGCSLLVSLSSLSGSPADGGGADAPDSTPDAVVDVVGDGGDAADGGPSCDPFGTFGTPVPIGSLASNTDDTRARLSSDELTIWFGRTFDGGIGDIFTATRANRDGGFGAAGPLPGVNSIDEDENPTVTADGLTLFFTSGKNSPDVFVATRSSPNGVFGGVTPVTTVNTASEETHPFIRADGLELWFSSDRPGGAGYRDLYRALRTGGVVAAPVRVAELATASEESSPALSADGLTIYFASQRPGGQGSRDVWTAHRSALDKPFSVPVVVPELNRPGDDHPSWISPDNCRIYLSSDRLGGAYRQTFVAERKQ